MAPARSAGNGYYARRGKGKSKRVIATRQTRKRQGAIKKTFVKKAEKLVRLCVSPLRKERANEVSEHPAVDAALPKAKVSA